MLSSYKWNISAVQRTNLLSASLWYCYEQFIFSFISGDISSTCFGVLLLHWLTQPLLFSGSSVLCFYLLAVSFNSDGIQHRQLRICCILKDIDSLWFCKNQLSKKITCELFFYKYIAQKSNGRKEDTMRLTTTIFQLVETPCCALAKVYFVHSDGTGTFISLLKNLTMQWPHIGLDAQLVQSDRSLLIFTSACTCIQFHTYILPRRGHLQHVPLFQTGCFCLSCNFKWC